MIIEEGKRYRITYKDERDKYVYSLEIFKRNFYELFNRLFLYTLDVDFDKLNCRIIFDGLITQNKQTADQIAKELKIYNEYFDVIVKPFLLPNTYILEMRYKAGILETLISYFKLQETILTIEEVDK